MANPGNSSHKEGGGGTLEAIFLFLKIILEILLKFDKMYSPHLGEENSFSF